MSTTLETITEYEAQRASLRVDRGRGILRRVKLLGLESKNGRSYPLTTIQRAAGLYEGVKVNVGHPKGSPSAPRDYKDRLGSIRNVVAEASGLYGDLHYNPKHALAEQLAWDAEHSPENVGLSHNIEGRTSRKGGKVVVEEIARVQSVDLVSDPATTRGLFEQTATEAVEDTRSFADQIHDRHPISESERAAYLYELTGRRSVRRKPAARQVSEVNSSREFAKSLRQ